MDKDDIMTHILTYGQGKTCLVRLAGEPTVKESVKYYTAIPGIRTYPHQMGIHRIPNTPETALKPIKKK